MQKKSSFSEQDLAFDQQHIWHPYTSLTQPLPTFPVVGANGVKLKLADGRELVDGMSSWWTAIHGYNVPELNKAVTDQLADMSHVMFGGITHQPAIDLCKRLVELTPKGLEKVFLADSGSVSVEVAMKMAVHYQQAKGKPQKNRFMSLKGGYHGDTTGAMSVCDPEGGMHHLFSDFLIKQFFIDRPKRRFGESYFEKEFLNLEQFFRLNSEKCAGFILEPIVQGAGGMWFYSADYLNKVRALCYQYDVLLITDEIATGFGRTGKLFAVEHADITPDIMCVGKALTGGYMTLAATLTTPEVANTICNGDAGVFMHGPTFMGNPLACAVAIKSLELLFRNDWQKRVYAIETQLKAELSGVADRDSVNDVRVLGAIGVVEMHEPVNVAAAQKFFVERKVWIRPFRNLLYVMPPYVIDEESLGLLTDAIASYTKK